MPEIVGIVGLLAFLELRATSVRVTPTFAGCAGHALVVRLLPLFEATSAACQPSVTLA